MPKHLLLTCYEISAALLLCGLSYFDHLPLYYYYYWVLPLAAPPADVLLTL
jgi:hypothetical protein